MNNDFQVGNYFLPKGLAMKRTFSRNDKAFCDTPNIVRKWYIAKYASVAMTQTFHRTPLIFLLLVPLIIGWATISDASVFVFDQRRTEVRFKYTMAYSTQRGRFTSVRGTLDYDEAVPGKSKVDALISAASLTTGEALVDSELKSASFFNVEASPVIRFRSVSVKSGSATAADVLGEVTVNGITKPVTLKVSIMPHNDPALKYDKGARKFIATTRIQRSAFNMTGYQVMVDDDVDIEINAIVRPK
jgi:polyisoprenoid-binding protein YceI